MRIVLTGGAGYIGSVVVRRLLEEGHHVIVVDDLSRGRRDAVPDPVPLIHHDAADLGTVISHRDRVDSVIHLAAYAYVGESVIHPARYWRNNVVGTILLLEAIRRLAIPRLIFASSCAVYGDAVDVPVTEDAVERPVNAYGMTKLASEMAISSQSRAYGLTATSLRFFNVAGAYGPAGDRHTPETHLIPRALAAAAGELPTLHLSGTDYPTRDGTCIRDYVHVLDLAEGIIRVLEKAPEGIHSTYNMGSGRGYSAREVITAVEEITGRTVPVLASSRREGDSPVLVASPEKIRRELGWHPTLPLSAMIADAWRFYRTQAARSG